MSQTNTIPELILELLRTENAIKGTHLPAQHFADRLRVSRSPINESLERLASEGILEHKKNRGYFLTQDAKRIPKSVEQKLKTNQSQDLVEMYFNIAEDRLNGLLPDRFSESFIKTRYGLTAAQVNALLGRIREEGWAEKNPGYGWEFSPMLTTPDSLLQSYRLRLALEPAALLEPEYHIDPHVLARCREAELHLLNGGIETDSADQLHARGVRFHESLIEASKNAFFIDTIRRVNRVRRLLSYRSMRDRKRYREHCLQHLEILDLLEQHKNEAASNALREHLKSTLLNHEKISHILEISTPEKESYVRLRRNQNNP